MSTPRHHRKPNARTTRVRPASGIPKAVIAVAILAVISIAGILFWQRRAASPVGIVRNGTVAILDAWKRGSAHPLDSTRNRLFSVTDWRVIDASAADRDGRVVVNVDSSTDLGSPIKATWVFSWQRTAADGWRATSMQKLDD